MGRGNERREGEGKGRKRKDKCQRKQKEGKKKRPLHGIGIFHTPAVYPADRKFSMKEEFCG